MEQNIQINRQPNFQMDKKNDRPKAKLNKLAILVITIVSLILILAIGTSIYFYKKANSNPQEDAAKELVRITNMVSKHMVLPPNESPTMATVSDPEKLKDQPFFANAKKGDKVLIFSESRKAILFDPVADKIIEVAPINSTAGAPTTN